MHKILLIEDDQVIRQQIGKMLSEWGFEVVLVEDFMEVLSLFVQSEPHLVLMDIGLPLFNGYHWCQEIRKISKVPIMFLSSRDQAMDIVMAINMGADDFVTKPFDQQVLLAKVQGLLRRSYEFGRDESLLEYAG
ncbi:response regulator transcription factor, partial [Streptococcus pneumoniae]